MGVGPAPIAFSTGHRRLFLFLAHGASIRAEWKQGAFGGHPALDCGDHYATCRPVSIGAGQVPCRRVNLVAYRPMRTDVLGWAHRPPGDDSGPTAREIYRLGGPVGIGA
jgi:hypothetical protein